MFIRGIKMKLALLDLDRTLLNSDYNLTVPIDKFRKVIQDLKLKDVQVGLCSDSAIVSLHQWSDLLGLTGPIIAERGAAVWDPVKQVINVIDKLETDWLSSFRDLFITEAMRNFQGATFMIGDATRFIKGCTSDSLFTENIFAINGFRVASFSVFARRLNHEKSRMEPSSELLTLTSSLSENLLKKFGKRKEDLFWDENPKYGILIIHSGLTEKWRGVNNIIHNLQPTEVIMVGDSLSDYLGLQYVNQYAVGNADYQYKEKSSYIASASLTEGVIDCLYNFAR